MLQFTRILIAYLIISNGSSVTVPGRAPVSSVKNLTVALYGTTKLTNGEAQAAMNVAGKVLQTSDFPGDIPCPVSFLLSGPVRASGDHSRIVVHDPPSLKEICSQPGDVHVVDAISYCGVDAPAIGCASANPSCMIVVRAYVDDFPDEEGILWAHEYGHTRGLGHRINTSAVMNSYVGDTERGVNQVECLAFQQTGPVSSQPFNAEHPPVKEFVHRRYFEGVPFDSASKYTKEDALVLIGMLGDADEKRFLGNIVATLGMIGDPIVIPPLKAFVESGSSEIDPTVADAKKFALTALGFVLNKTSDEDLLVYLKGGIFPPTWSKRVHWNIPGEESAKRNLDLAVSSIKGLGVSGIPEAGSALKGVGFSIGPEAAVIQPAISRAIELNSQIQKLGLKEYYQKQQIQ